ncbi:MBL fold metallo-hydrolase [Treponema parvum]|uniref:MBL fold metallo-hydrolase n=1 Tax=Treponema parvum TaxID=138851 RepID=A0A975F2J6_9SPIR|nr:MBL fold metallo-hydrolase [Treponema parvum]QTQ13120.1 MBL fold metallo-hydrolase [Treponema parvum]
MGISLYSLGAAQEVTGSKHIIEMNGRSYMIDCGAFQGKRAISDEKNRSFSFPTDKLEAVILTHAHYDHCGLLPILVKHGFEGNIYATPATRDLANLVMMDSARIQARDAEYLAKRAAKKGEKFNWSPLFNEADCTKAADQIITLSYRRKMYISPDVQLEFFDAGHILGSAYAYVTIKGRHGGLNAPAALSKSGSNEIRILYTGDLGRPDKAIIRNPEKDVPAPDYIFLESTYGNRLHEDKNFAMQELEKIVNSAVVRKGKIIIPSFAIERAQELVYYLHLLVDQKKIPQIPIYVDSPMAVSATGIFGLHPECYDNETHEAFLKHHKNPFGFGVISYITSVEESKSLNDKSGPMIIISADGMCEAGRILHHLANNISNPDNTVLIVGYMAENTLGRRIRDGEKEVKILNDWYQVRAKVEQINAFSAHADYSEMINWLNSIDKSRLKQIFIVHGEADAQKSFIEHLSEAGYKDVTIVKYGEVYDIE